MNACSRRAALQALVASGAYSLSPGVGNVFAAPDGKAEEKVLVVGPYGLGDLLDGMHKKNLDPEKDTGFGKIVKASGADRQEFVKTLNRIRCFVIDKAIRQDDHWIFGEANPRMMLEEQFVCEFKKTKLWIYFEKIEVHRPDIVKKEELEKGGPGRLAMFNFSIYSFGSHEVGILHTVYAIYDTNGAVLKFKKRLLEL